MVSLKKNWMIILYGLELDCGGYFDLFVCFLSPKEDHRGYHWMPSITA